MMTAAITASTVKSNKGYAWPELPNAHALALLQSFTYSPGRDHLCKARGAMYNDSGGVRARRFTFPTGSLSNGPVEVLYQPLL